MPVLTSHHRRWRRVLGSRLLPSALSIAVQLQSSDAASKHVTPLNNGILTTWTIEDGLPSNVVRDIVRTSDGFLWLATMGGLVRFDGTRFRVYDTVELSALNAPRFVTLEVDRGGRLWTGAVENDALSFDGERWAWHPPISAPMTIAAESDGGLLFGGYWGAGRWRAGNFEQLTDKTTLVLTTDRQGRAWGGSRGGVFRFHESGVDVVDASIHVWSMQALPEGGIAVHDKEGQTWLFPSGTEKDMGALEGQRVWSRAVDSENNHWFGTEAGLYRVSQQEWSAQAPDFGADSLILPPPALIKAILPDRNGRVWLGSEVHGLQLYQPPFVDLLDVKHVIPMADGSMWAITHDETAIRTRGDVVLEQPPIENVTALRPGASDTVWVSNLVGDGAAELWRCQRGRCESALRPGPVLRSAHPVYEEPTGTLLQTGNGETIRFDGERILGRFSGKWLGTTASGATWFGQLDTLTREHAGQLDVIPFPDGVDGAEFYSAYEDSRGHVWISTYGHGLWLFLYGKFHRLTTANGLPSNMVGALIEDERERLWINSNRGVFVASIERLIRATEVPGYRAPTKLVTNLEMFGAIPAYRGPDGTLFFSSIDGAVAIDPRIMGDPESPPTATIDRLRSGSVVITPGARVELPLGTRSFEIEFTAAYLQPTATPWFRYRLDDTEGQWVEAGDQRSAHYAALQPGTYQFTVQARNQDGEWGDTDTLLIVLPVRFYETGWFRGLFFGLFGVALLGIYISQRRLIHTRGAALRHEQKKHQAESAARRLTQRLSRAEETVRQRIAQELHDDVSQRLALLAIQLGSRAENEDLMQMTRELASDLHRVSHDLHPAKLRYGLGPALRGLVSRMDQFETVVELSGDVASITGEPALCLYRVAQEALNNAMRHSHARNVRLELTVDEEDARMSIEDDGIGFEESIEAEGLGLGGMADRVQGLGGEFTLDTRPGKGTQVRVRLPLRRS